jgi:hypothetical protein
VWQVNQKVTVFLDQIQFFHQLHQLVVEEVVVGILHLTNLKVNQVVLVVEVNKELLGALVIHLLLVLLKVMMGARLQALLFHQPEAVELEQLELLLVLHNQVPVELV